MIKKLKSKAQTEAWQVPDMPDITKLPALEADKKLAEYVTEILDLCIWCGGTPVRREDHGFNINVPNPHSFIPKGYVPAVPTDYIRRMGTKGVDFDVLPERYVEQTFDIV